MPSRLLPTHRARTHPALRILSAAAIGLIAWLAIAPDAARAHARSSSYSSWQVSDESIRVRVRITLLELSRLPLALPSRAPGAGVGLADETGRYLEAHLSLTADGAPCELDSPPASRLADEGWVAYEWSLHCAPGASRTITSRILLAEAPSHLHFARVTLARAPEPAPKPGAPQADAPPILERVLSEAQPSWTLSVNKDGAEPSFEATGSSFGSYLLLGIEHILTGWDHLAFVLALVLLAGHLGEVAKLVTGFTLAHSLTLALAVLGLVHPEAAPVEAVIGFSVALLAAENVWLLAARNAWVPAIATGGLVVLALLAVAGLGEVSILTLSGLAIFTACHFALMARSQRQTLLRIALAFAFGLVHGFGFAGVLAEMALPTHRLAPALIGFNLGVELGQLSAVALIWPLLAFLERRGEGELHRRTAEWASAAVCGVGVFWFVTRTFSGA
jgi:hypothetical protein